MGCICFLHYQTAHKVYVAEKSNLTMNSCLKFKNPFRQEYRGSVKTEINANAEWKMKGYVFGDIYYHGWLR